MHTERYLEVKAQAKRKGKCPTCEKPVTRTRTFTKTVNPFNRNAVGEPKTYAEVQADVNTEAEAWQPSEAIFEHDKCLDHRNQAEAEYQAGLS